jgi:1A family penicillin-binding protein
LPRDYSSIRVFDNQGRYVGRIIPERRYWVSIDRIPSFLRKAVIAVEDSRFYEHSGIDVRGIARALVKDVVKGRMAEGGSTITQQLIKNKYLSGEKTIDRKLTEGRMALEFEQKYTKNQILEMYFNEIYYGNGAWGIAQAARLYFDKNPEELSEAECALLAGVQKAPGVYNPRGKTSAVTGRRDVVLQRMVELGMISRAKQQQLREHPPSVIPPGQAVSYMAHVRAKLIEQYGAGIIEQGGLEVTAALDLRLQKLAEKSLSEGVRRISPQLQGALICLDATSGDLLAVVGGVDADGNGYNRALSAKRQPGSTIKPLIFAAALEKGYTAASILNDSPVGYPRGNGGVWKPLNYGGERFGDQTLRQALAHSNNVITVKLLDAIGVPYFAGFAANLGLPLRAQHDLTLALGTEEVTLADLVLTYAPLANGGSRPKARTIIRIYDRRRGTWLNNPPVLTPVLSPGTAYVTTQMMRDVMLYGTAKNLKGFSMKWPSAGKTGTTDNYRDAWFVGFTPQIVTGVWVGHDRPKSGGKGFTGGAVSAPIWGQFMRQAVAGRPVVDFTPPDTVLAVSIDPTTGFLATADCPVQRQEFFVLGTQPTGTCPEHGGTGPVPPPVPLVEPDADAKRSPEQP